MNLVQLFLALASLSPALSQAQFCTNQNADPTPNCEDSGPVCSSYYPTTFFPNNITSRSTQAINAIQIYETLVNRGCSPLSELLICLAFAPECDSGGRYRMPCRDLCESVYAACTSDIQFLTDLNCLLVCERYPTTDCVGLADPLVLGIVGPSTTQPTTEPATVSTGTETGNTSIECPAEKFFTESAKSFSLGWLAFWSVICFLSTTLTIATFLLDSSRFPYPWRPVVYLALSFNLHSLTYFLAMAIGSEIVTCPGGEFVQTSVTWTWGHTPCILVFGLLYFTMMTAFLWWLILSFGWFLTSAFSWSSEAVAHLAPFYHAIAWILPIVLTIVLVATRVVGADELTGTCFIVRDVSNNSFLALLLGVIIPLVLCLITGAVFLIIGFVSILNIRSVMRSKGKSRESSILEKLVVRIGIFVVVFIIPACIVIGCFIYELISRPSWTPVTEDCTDCVRASTAVFMVRIFMFLLTGILTGIWIWSKKTLNSWKMCPQRIIACCKMPRDEDQEIPSSMNAYVNEDIYTEEGKF